MKEAFNMCSCALKVYPDAPFYVHLAAKHGALGKRALVRATCAPRPLVPHLHQDWARPCHICACTSHRCHVCTGTGLTPATSAPGQGSPSPTSAVTSAAAETESADGSCTASRWGGMPTCAVCVALLQTCSNG